MREEGRWKGREVGESGRSRGERTSAGRTRTARSRGRREERGWPLERGRSTSVDEAAKRPVDARLHPSARTLDLAASFLFAFHFLFHLFVGSAVKHCFHLQSLCFIAFF